MDDKLMEQILNMYKSTKPFNIVIPTPSSRRRVREDRSVLDEGPHPCHSDKRTMESEKEYVKEYVQKDNEEYLKVISMKICNDIAVCILFVSFVFCLSFFVVNQ